jgi:hypothetical protein
LSIVEETFAGMTDEAYHAYMPRRAVEVAAAEKRLGRLPRRKDLGLEGGKDKSTNSKAPRRNEDCGTGVVWTHDVWLNIQPKDPKNPEQVIPWDPVGHPGKAKWGDRIVKGMRTDSQVWHFNYFNHCPDHVIRCSEGNSIANEIWEESDVHNIADAEEVHRAMSRGMASCSGRASELFAKAAFKDPDAPPDSPKPKQKKVKDPNAPKLPKRVRDLTKQALVNAEKFWKMREKTDNAMKSLAKARAEACVDIDGCSTTAAGSPCPSHSAAAATPSAAPSLASMHELASVDSSAAAVQGPMQHPVTLGHFFPTRKDMQQVACLEACATAYRNYVKEFATLSSYRKATERNHRKMITRFTGRLSEKCKAAYSAAGENSLRRQDLLEQARDIVLPAMNKLIVATKGDVDSVQVRDALTSVHAAGEIFECPGDVLDFFWEEEVRFLLEQSDYKLLWTRLCLDADAEDFNLTIGGFDIIGTEDAREMVPRWKHKQLPCCKAGLVHLFSNSSLDVPTFRRNVYSFVDTLDGKLASNAANEKAALSTRSCRLRRVHIMQNKQRAERSSYGISIEIVTTSAKIKKHL